MSEEQKTETAPKKVLKTIAFDLKTRTWELSFYGWDECDHDIILEFEKSLQGMSWNLICKNLHCGMNVGIYLKNDDGTKGPLQNSIRVDIPNMWPDADHHAVYSEDQIKLLYHILIRDAHNTLFQKLADSWRNKAAAESGALEFNVNFQKETNNVATQT